MVSEEAYYLDHNFTNGTPISLCPIQIEGNIQKHAHDFYEISYIKEGNGTLKFSTQTLPVSKGDIIFIPYGKEHLFVQSNTTDHTPLEVMNCLFDKQILTLPGEPADSQIQEDFYRLALLFRECTDYIQVRENAKEFAKIMYTIEMEQKCKSTGFRYKLYLYLIDLLEHISHAMQQIAHVSKPIITDPIQYAIDDITRNYKNPLSVDQICKQFLISSRQFQRKFKQASGMTYTKMLQDIRIHESCSLLLDTHWSVQTIALEVGIHDMKYFYRIFKERCGLTPHEFRFHACSNIQ
ncbi:MULTISPECIES: helix-turn-helix domain-containing protein [Paenibacillus]|uniref:helix-turn-helix domain-containing protein n=1 Tax=Paenibacillus TaxID=44249 RepID=UPI00030537CD|nr:MULTISPECIES: helix-turn-helix domain-containing protein [Paenibacillus]AHM66219.1 hypothetical protein PPSQR21_025770 [Paenibacillus polymyxa SQR-21]AIY07166.1 AraC family transcriptional regulator [Paenibacillus polymyxa]AUS26858.1 hypothetical protein C1A50_2691 [Paenibacillus polymyxa]KJD40601.1 AraC family transcriptional regulator [Paenibacillus polymyxa]KJK30957.1 AraC family transcriptional regulator [Paenibacillus polymyxa]